MSQYRCRLEALVARLGHIVNLGQSRGKIHEHVVHVEIEDLLHIYLKPPQRVPMRKTSPNGTESFPVGGITHSTG